jgi:hypothetical protein
VRDDMASVIVERPRIPAGKTRAGRRRDPDDLPSHEGMRRHWALRGDRKSLNENLAPLRRYLERQVGRPWNKVYAEIAAHLRIDSAVQQHVRDHLKDFVAVKPRRGINGRWGFRGGLWPQPFHVDPVNGLLCRTDRLPEEKARRRREQRRPDAPVDRIVLEDRAFRRLKGVWFEVRLVPPPAPESRVRRIVHDRTPDPDGHGRIGAPELMARHPATPARRDLCTRSQIAAGPSLARGADREEHRRAEPDRRQGVVKRTLSRRELRRHGLTNQPDDLG